MRTRRISVVALSCAALLAATACNKPAQGGTNTSGGANTIAVSDINLGRAINADLTIKDATESFRPVDIIYASIATKGAAPATLGVRWTYQDNQVVEDGTRDIHPTGPTRTEFHLSKQDGLAKGHYR